MIISDQHKYVFIHIPKCAGTSLKQHFEIYEDAWNVSGIWKRNHPEYPELGILDHAHIPLFTLKDFFKDEYEKLNSYRTFAVIRDPYKRFPSSMAQRLNMHCGTQIQYLTKKEIIQEVDSTINFLAKNSTKNTQLPVEYIHFQRQVDYIYLNGNKIIDSVFTIDNLDILLDQFYEYIGCEMPSNEKSKKNNQSIVFKNDILRQTIEAVRPFTQFAINHMPKNLKEKLRSKVYVPSAKRHADIFQSSAVTDFIKDYYKDDIKLVEQQQSEESEKKYT